LIAGRLNDAIAHLEKAGACAGKARCFIRIWPRHISDEEIWKRRRRPLTALAALNQAQAERNRRSVGGPQGWLRKVTESSRELLSTTKLFCGHRRKRPLYHACTFFDRDDLVRTADQSAFVTIPLGQAISS